MCKRIVDAKKGIKKSGWQDSNLWLPRPERGTLPS